MIYDLRPEEMRPLEEMGAEAAASAREVAEFAEVIELSVTDDAAVEAAILGPNGALEGARPGSVFAVHSTIHPTTVKKVAAAARPRGIGVIDASPSRAGDGGIWMVGGEAADLETCRPVLEAFSTNIFHMGELGTGCATKCAQQLITTVNILGAYEGFQLASATGVDMDRFSELVHLSSAQSRSADNWLNGMFNGLEERRRDALYKGLIPILRLAREAGLSVPGAALSQQTIITFPDPA
jgi:3-hydroxyisobutyrate dehydrogenase-like beta-hydroxyacid dehydrogenase